MPVIEFIGQTVRDGDNIAVNPSRLINLYREGVGAGGRSQTALKPVAVMEPFAETDQVAARGLARVQESIFAAVGGRLLDVGSAGVVTELGVINDDLRTTLSGSSAPTQARVSIAAGGEYYLWDGSSLTTPETGAFDAVGSVTFGAQYTIITERGGSRFQWSEPGRPDTFDASDFATAESRDDEIIRGEFIAGNLWLFGQRSVEVWSVTGQSGPFAFRRLAGAVMGVGLKSFNLLSAFEGASFFVGNDGSAYITSGAGLRKISTPPLDVALAQNVPDRCFYYEHQGHKFCVIRFADAPSWCYDMTTEEWHERSEGVDHDPWTIVAMVRGDDGFIGINDLGLLSKASAQSASTAERLRRTAVSRTLYFDGERRRLAELEFFGRAGFSDIGRDAKMEVSLSKDGGVIWGRPRQVSLGDLGEYGARQVLRSLGQFRQVTARVDMTDHAFLTLNSSCRVRVA